jgi:hypothetical protein
MFLLHGREMNVPNSHHLRAKRSPEAQRLDKAVRLRNLQSALRLANKTVRENIRLSYARNKRYYDQSAKVRTLKEGDTVYVHNPARKPGVSRKLTLVWTGPCRIRKSFGHQNFCGEDTRGKETLMQTNRLNLANDPSVWRPKREEPRPCRRTRRQLDDEAVGEPTVTRHSKFSFPVLRLRTQ